MSFINILPMIQSAMLIVQMNNARTVYPYFPSSPSRKALNPGYHQPAKLKETVPERPPRKHMTAIGALPPVSYEDAKPGDIIGVPLFEAWKDR